MTDTQVLSLLGATVTRVPADAPSVLDCGTSLPWGPWVQGQGLMGHGEGKGSTVDDNMIFCDHGGSTGGKRPIPRWICRKP